MGTKERRERERRRRADRILAVTRRLFIMHGLKEVTMDQIAEACELAKGTLYLYFSNKSELFAELVIRFHAGLFARFDEVAGQKVQGLEKLRLFGMAWRDYYAEQEGFLPLLQAASSREFLADLGEDRSARIREIERNAFIRLSAAIEDCVAGGSLKPEVNPFELALILAGSSTGILQLIGCMVEAPPGVNPDLLLHRTWELLLDSLATGPLPEPPDGHWVDKHV